MNMPMIRSFLTILFFLTAGLCTAQDAPMADTMRSDGKIYVVISVIAVVFISLALFLVYLDRKLSRVERRLREGKEKGNS
jgi:hypothetical protein